MIADGKCLVLDIDGTLCPTKLPTKDYDELAPFPEVVERIREYQAQGFYIILYTSRNMRTYQGNMGLINANTAKVMTAWLDRHQIPYDEIHFGKPWSGNGGFYVDDKTVRPDEFLRLSYDDIRRLLEFE